MYITFIHIFVSVLFPNIFEGDPNLSLVNLLWPKPQTVCVHISKVIIVWMMFDSKLLIPFSMTGICSSRRQTQTSSASQFQSLSTSVVKLLLNNAFYYKHNYFELLWHSTHILIHPFCAIYQYFYGHLKPFNIGSKLWIF